MNAAVPHVSPQHTLLPDDGTPAPTVPRPDSPSVPSAAPEGANPTGGDTTTTVVTTDDGTTIANDGPSLVLVGVLLLGALLAGMVIGWLLGLMRDRSAGHPSAPNRAQTTPQAVPTIQTLPTTPPAGSPRYPGAMDVDATLVEVAIDVRDRVGNPVLADRLGSALASVGVSTLDPTGELFDPRVHTAVDRTPTDDKSLHDHVASVERLGYHDPTGRFERLPEVVVYQYPRTSFPGARP